MTTVIGENQRKEARGDVCDYCSGSFQCGRLFTALKILAADQEKLKANPELSRVYEQVAALLARSGWNYPEGRSPCDLVNSSDLIAQMTTDLIQLMGDDFKKGSP